MMIAFDNSYSKLPDGFYSRQNPTPVAAPALVRFNNTLAAEIGVNAEVLDLEVLAGNRIPSGADPIAQAYAGHQFGNFVAQLGDGRAILLGEVVGPDGIRRDLQLKGCGPTLYSRDGDGRAAIGPVIREFVVSEAMATLGIPTTRALAAVTTGENIIREQVLPGAILARVASSHIRVGTFQFHFANGDLEALRLLTDHVIERHYPDAATAANPVLALLERVSARQAELIARWMQVGFIHGVMNTDNMSIAGETIDYGPCAFMDGYHPGRVFSSIDRQGRYSWGNQPQVAHWNLSQFARTLVALIPGDQETAKRDTQTVLDTFPEAFSRAYASGFARKIGLLTDRPEDSNLINDLLGLMAVDEVDFTLFFRHLTESVETGDDAALRAPFKNPDRFDSWTEDWRRRTEGDDAKARVMAMRAVNPVFIPRNHRLEEVIAAANTGDYAPFERLLAVLAHPYEQQPENAAYENPPEPDEIVHATFCGT
jgi:uncharacterized protein YdiU (UPF0061 family)